MTRSTLASASTVVLLAGMLVPASLAPCSAEPYAAPSVASPPSSLSGAAPTLGAALLLAATTGTDTTDPVNKVCPIKGGEVDTESPTRQFRGVTIGFCCLGCEGKWDKTTDEEKTVLLARHAPEAAAAIEAAAKIEPEAAPKDIQPDADALASNPAVKVARGYLAACEKADAAALNALFLDTGRATVSENASDEGTWETYRDHHLLPELRNMPGFKMTVKKEDARTFGSASIVRQIGSFTVPDPESKELTRAYLAAVTYIVVDDGGTPRIAHLHWSSRAEKKADGAAPATPDAGHGNGAGHGHR